VERVLSYFRLQALWPLAPGEIQNYIEALAEVSDVVHPGPPRSTVSADPDDDPVVETAIPGRADYLYILDRHSYSREVLEFLRRHSIQVLSDMELLDLLRRAAAAK
jgi:predicted nucleic acid-binding protein